MLSDPIDCRHCYGAERKADQADAVGFAPGLRGLKKLHLYQPGTNLRAWLFTVMHNLYVNSHRRAARQGQTIHVEKVQLSTPASQVSRLELRDLERAIASLPEDQRTTLLLIGLEGMRYEDVAQICDIPIGTVRSRVSRARETLRHMLKGEDSESDRRNEEAGGTTYPPVEPKLHPVHDSTTPT